MGFNGFLIVFKQVSKKACGVRATLSERGEYHSQRPPTPLLDTINYPIHMKNLSIKVNNSCPSFNFINILLYLHINVTPYMIYIWVGNND